MSKDDPRPIDSLAEEFSQQSDSITSEKSSSDNPETSSESNTLSLEDIRTAGL